MEANTRPAGSRLSRLDAMGIELPPVPAAVASYVPAVRSGSTALTSGQLPVVDGALPVAGRVGDGVTTEVGYDLARIAALNALAALHAVVGLDEVERIVRVAGYVASADGFVEQARVVDGASDLLQEVFGADGQHVRSAIGVASLPLGAPVEIEVHVQLRTATSTAERG